MAGRKRQSSEEREAEQARQREAAERREEILAASYVVWWLVLVLVGGAVALALGFPHSFLFVPGVLVWSALMTGLGLWIDSLTDRGFSRGAVPFGQIYRLRG